ncbi:MAG: hypothetical protein IJ421_00175 [Prevotella sp.]|nr:hypothetical protein [Prevotella sp.]
MSDLIYKLDKTPADINTLIAENKNLVYFVLSRLGCLGVADYESAAFEALWNAVQTFDVFGERAFSTYACTCIRNRVNDMRRREKIRKENEQTVDFTTLQFEIPVYDCAIEVESLETISRIQQYTKEYLDNQKPGSNPYNIIKTWSAYNFSIAAKDIAIICNTAPANVSRVQATFRAYLRSKLR